MASIKDIAKALGVSVSTVSLALNDKPRVSEKMRETIKQKAKEMNYVKNGIATDLQRKHTNIILFIVNDASRSFFSAIINHLQKATAAFGYDLIICTTYGDHLSTAKRFMEEKRADAAIIYTGTIPDSMIQSYARDDFPIVVLGRYVPGDHIFCFLKPVQNIKHVLLTTEYLIQTGHKRISFVKGSSASLGTSRSFQEYKYTLEKYGLPYDESIVFDAKGASYDIGYQITEKILPIISQLDAIQYSTDDNAIGGVLCLKRNGIRVPEDISVTGKTNVPESAFTSPTLTTCGSIEDQYLFYEGLIHYLVMIIEKNEEYNNISTQLYKHLSSYLVPDVLIKRESVKKRN